MARAKPDRLESQERGYTLASGKAAGDSHSGVHSSKTNPNTSRAQATVAVLPVVVSACDIASAFVCFSQKRKFRNSGISVTFEYSKVAKSAVDFMLLARIFPAVFRFEFGD